MMHSVKPVTLSKRMLCIILATVMLAILVPLSGSAYDSKTGKITCSPGYGVNVRTGPGTNNSIVTTLDRGDSITIIGEGTASDGLWYNITYSGGSGWVRSDFVIIDVNYEPDGDFEAYLDEQGFPESYKDSLRELHARYPNWVFKAMHVGFTWDEAIEGESILGHSLVEDYMPSSWKSTAPGAYNWDTGEYVIVDSSRWVNASAEIIAYYMDPRNFLDTSGVFQFLEQSFDGSIQTVDGVRSLISGTFMDTSSIDYAQIIYDAGKDSGVNPYVLATMIITEQGRTGSEMVSGTYSGLPGYYNFFNFGANGTTVSQVLYNGLSYAKENGWDTPEKSIKGGASQYAKGYVNAGQTTLYLKRFNVQGEKPFYHQYMTSIYGAASEGSTLASEYTEDIRKSALTFYIPVYSDMPETACQKPTGDGSPDNRLSSLSVGGYSLTPAFSNDQDTYDLVVPSNVNTITITAKTKNSKATVSGTGTVTLSGTLTTCTIKVTAQNGAVREFTVHIAREYVDDMFTNTYKVYGSYIRGIPLGTDADTFEKNLVSSGSASVIDSKGNPKDGTLCTGDKVVIYEADGESTYGVYDIVIMGDVSSDGNINISDIIKIKNNIINVLTLSDTQELGADVNGNSMVDVGDIVKIKNYIIGIGTITQ